MRGAAAQAEHRAPDHAHISGRVVRPGIGQFFVSVWGGPRSCGSQEAVLGFRVPASPALATRGQQHPNNSYPDPLQLSLITLTENPDLERVHHRKDVMDTIGKERTSVTQAINDFENILRSDMM